MAVRLGTQRAMLGAEAAEVQGRPKVQQVQKGNGNTRRRESN